MQSIKLSNHELRIVVAALKQAGYHKHSENEKYVKFSRRLGDCLYIHQELLIIRCYAGTRADLILKGILGQPNGFVKNNISDVTYSSWFLNGYSEQDATTNINNNTMNDLPRRKTREINYEEFYKGAHHNDEPLFSETARRVKN